MGKCVECNEYSFKIIEQHEANFILSCSKCGAFVGVIDADEVCNTPKKKFGHIQSETESHLYTGVS